MAHFCNVDKELRSRPSCVNLVGVVPTKTPKRAYWDDPGEPKSQT